MPGSRCRPGFQFSGWDIAEQIDNPVVVVEHANHLELLGFAVYDKDRRNERWVKSWLVVKENDESPSFFGLYFTKEQAEEARQQAGHGYIVVYGSKKIGSNDEFLYSTFDQKNVERR